MTDPAALSPSHSVPTDDLLAFVRRQSVAALADEALRCHALGIRDLILHPGSHGGEGEAAGVARIAQALDEVFRLTEGTRVQYHSPFLASKAALSLALDLNQQPWVPAKGKLEGPVIVTGIERPAGLVVRCPKCFQEHPARPEWLGEVITCPTLDCDLRLRINSFVVRPLQLKPLRHARERDARAKPRETPKKQPTQQEVFQSTIRAWAGEASPKRGWFKRRRR